MKIHIEVKSDRYRYLWLKYVTGFDITQHCAKCLRGSYSRLIAYRSQRIGNVYEGVLDEYEAPYVYLCGVTNKHADNLHIAFRQKADGCITYEDERINVVIQQAEQIAILPVLEPFPPAFATCRNFQFGYHAFPEMRQQGVSYA